MKWNGRVRGDGQDFPDGLRAEDKRSLGRISRSADGRFVVETSVRSNDRNSSSSSGSSSDDGGFLTRRNGFRLRAFDRASWRRPLVAYPSELSLRSDGTGQSYLGEHTILKYLREKSPSPFLKIPISGSPAAALFSSPLPYGRKRETDYAYSPSSSVARRFPPKSPSQMSQSSYFQRLTRVPAVYPLRDRSGLPLVATVEPPAVPKFYSSSPARSDGKLSPLWSPGYDFSDLSSVPYLGSTGERSFADFSPRWRPGYAQLKNIHQRYARELPSLRAIHEENFLGLPRDAAFFMPVRPSPPRIRIPPQQWSDFRSSGRLPHRHSRQARSAPELNRYEDHGAIPAETSPESRSSSSGFGSKNTSSQQNQSSQSGSTTDWRILPSHPPRAGAIVAPGIVIPYRFTPDYSLSSPPSYVIGDWFDFAPTDARGGQSSSSDLTKVDASVDGHYEFDTVFSTTPTPPIPGIVSTTYARREFPNETTVHYAPSFYPASAAVQKPKQRISSTRYDNIEARVQAMKEEYYAFRRRQEKRKKAEQLESAC